MSFSITLPTRHTDTYTNTGFVHAGVLLALTELAYDSFERHCKLTKPKHVVAVQKETTPTSQDVDKFLVSSSKSR